MKAKLMGIVHRGKNLDDQSGWLEPNLGEALKPVEPRPEFVRRLRGQLINQYHPVREEIRAEKQRTILILGAGFLGAALAVVMGVRMFVTILAGIGLIMQLKKKPAIPATVTIQH